MKRYIISVFVLAVAAVQALACTNVIVGKQASADGSVMVSYNADSYGMYGNLYRHVGGKHAPGEMRKVYDWDSNRYLGEIPQAERTYNVVGQMNENQVSITETTFGGREELADSTGLIDYGSLIYITLERATSARNAIDIMTSLVSQYGYYSEGETFSICDKNEAWIMEMVGKGPGSKGAVWVAIRVPDDCVCAHANQSRITRFNMKDKENVIYSKDIIKFAREKGYFRGTDDATFSFRNAFAPNDFSAVRYCDARAWSVYNRLCDGMDRYIEYAKGEELHGELPLFVKPKKPVTLQNVMECMRDHYEGTPFDIQNEIGAGPYNMPYRPTPLSYKVDGVEYFNERPISTQQTSFCFIGQMRNWLPNEIGGCIWWTNDDSNMAPFTPMYCGITEVPECYVRMEGVQDDVNFRFDSAFWMQNVLSNMVYPYYDKMYPDLRAKKDELEAGYFNHQRTVETQARTQYETDPEGAVKALTTYSLEAARDMMAEWQDLYVYMIVKHNDMAVKKVDKRGQFTKTRHGFASSPERPGYPEPYRRRIVNETRDKYRIFNK